MARGVADCNTRKWEEYWRTTSAKKGKWGRGGGTSAAWETRSGGRLPRGRSRLLENTMLMLPFNIRPNGDLHAPTTMLPVRAKSDKAHQFGRSRVFYLRKLKSFAPSPILLCPCTVYDPCYFHGHFQIITYCYANIANPHNTMTMIILFVYSSATKVDEPSECPGPRKLRRPPQVPHIQNLFING